MPGQYIPHSAEAQITSHTALDKIIEEAYISLDSLTTAMHPQSEDFYSKRLAEYDKQKSEFEVRLNELQSQKAARLSRKELLDGLIRSMEESGVIVTGFDENLWRLMAERAVVRTDGKLTFTLRNGMEK